MRLSTPFRNLPFNQRVVGSIPTALTIEIHEIKDKIGAASSWRQTVLRLCGPNADPPRAKADSLGRGEYRSRLPARSLGSGVRGISDLSVEFPGQDCV
jgi:hypothetical protein